MDWENWETTLSIFGYLTAYTGLACVILLTMLVTYMATAYVLFGIVFNL